MRIEIRNAAVAILLVFPFALAIAAQEHGEWIKYNSPAGRYDVSLPKQPQLSTQDTTASSGEKLPQYMALSGTGKHWFMVGYFDYLANMTFSLDKARDGMIEGLHATLLKEDQISLGGLPGKQIKVVAKSEGEDFIDWARFYDIDRRVYVLQCIFPKAEDGAPVMQDCDRFFDSFKVTK